MLNEKMMMTALVVWALVLVIVLPVSAGTPYPATGTGTATQVLPGTAHFTFSSFLNGLVTQGSNNQVPAHKGLLGRFMARPGNENGQVSAETQETVPTEYRSLYSNLKSDMDTYQAGQQEQSSATLQPIVFGAELIPANCNIGEGLLKPGAMEGVKLYLDSLQAIGVRGVTVPIHYPLYTPEFPRYEEYRTFYRQVAQEVHARNMSLVVENHVLFANTDYSPVKWNYAGVTSEKYKLQKKSMVQQIIDDTHPEYLDLGAEPDTESALTGWKWLNNPGIYTDIITDVTTGLDAGDTKIGAGIGTWGNMEYVDRYAENPGLDFISIHVYPVFGKCLTNIERISTTAHNHNKGVIIDEAWLYKTDVPPPVGIGPTTTIYGRDVYSFWYPLDEQFLEIMVTAARQNNIEYLSPFWSNYFFGSLDYSPSSAKLSYAERRSLVNKVTARNLMKGVLSPTGEHYQKLIMENT